MSYLATLRRPVESTPGVTAPPAHVPAAEPFIEVHREVEAAPSRASSPEPASSIDRPTEQAASSPAVEGRRPALTRSAPAEADRLESTIEGLSPQQAPSPAPRSAGEPSPVVQPRASVPTSALSMPSAQVSHEAHRTPHRGDHDEVAHEREQPPERAPTRLSVLPIERGDKAAGRTTASASPGRGKLNVHIGAISLTVKAPTVASPLAAPVIAPALPSAAAPRSREGLGFSASRHYLRWN